MRLYEPGKLFPRCVGDWARNLSVPNAGSPLRVVLYETPNEIGKRPNCDRDPDSGGISDAWIPGGWNGNGTASSRTRGPPG